MTKSGVTRGVTSENQPIATDIILNRNLIISGGCNRGVPMYIKTSIFQVVGTEGLHCIQRHCHFRESE